VKFRAKGPATVQVRLATPATTPKENGGVCEKGCYDSHGKLFMLSDTWDEYVLRFDRVQQGGWGTEARFDPARVLDLNFLVAPKDLPADFWIDEIEFVAAAPAGKAERTVVTPGNPEKGR